ncbi:MAG: hypothetical protein Q4D58_00045 [Synergistaceae bacterium]|nr:hypothetical protein [Synergistaceae bacterium]
MNKQPQALPPFLLLQSQNRAQFLLLGYLDTEHKIKKHIRAFVPEAQRRDED